MDHVSCIGKSDFQCADLTHLVATATWKDMLGGFQLQLPNPNTVLWKKQNNNNHIDYQENVNQLVHLSPSNCNLP